MSFVGGGVKVEKRGGVKSCRSKGDRKKNLKKKIGGERKKLDQKKTEREGKG